MESVERLLKEMTRRYEGMWRDNAALRARVSRQEQELAAHRQEARETREVLITAQQAAEALRRQAAADVQRRLEAAETEVRGLLEDSAAKVARGEAEVRRLQEVGEEIQSGFRAFLLAALERLESRALRLEAGADAGSGSELPEGDGEPAGRPHAVAHAGQ